MRTLILKVELHGNDINIDLDSPLVTNLRTLISSDIEDPNPLLRGVSKVDVGFQYSEQEFDE